MTRKKFLIPQIILSCEIGHLGMISSAELPPLRNHMFLKGKDDVLFILISHRQAKSRYLIEFNQRKEE